MVRYISIRRMVNRSGSTDTSVTPNVADGSEYEYDLDKFLPNHTANANPATQAPKAHFLDQTSEDIGIDQGLIFPETSAQRVMRNRIQGQIAISGDIQVPVYPTGVPTLFYYALGHSSEPSGGKYRISTNSGAAAPWAFQMGVGKDLKEHRFTGCVVRTFTIDFDPSEVVLATFGILARKELTEGTILGVHAGSKNSYVTFGKYGVTPAKGDYNKADRAFGGTEVKTFISKDGSAISESGNNSDQVNNVESMSIEMDNGFIDDHYAIGDQYLPNAYVQNFTVNGSMELGYSDHSDYKDVVTEKEWIVRLKAGYGRGGDARGFEVNLPQIALKTANLPTEGTDRYLLNIDWEGERKGGSNDLITIDITHPETKAVLQL